MQFSHKLCPQDSDDFEQRLLHLEQIELSLNGI